MVSRARVDAARPRHASPARSAAGAPSRARSPRSWPRPPAELAGSDSRRKGGSGAVGTALPSECESAGPVASALSWWLRSRPPQPAAARAPARPAQQPRCVWVCGRARAEVDWWAHTRRCRLRVALPPRHRTRPVPGADTGLSVTRAHRPGRLPGFEWLSRRPCRGSAGHQRPTRGTCPAPTPASPTRDAAPHAFQWRGLPGH